MAGSETHFRQKGDIHMKKWVLIADADEQFRNELVTALQDSEEFEVMGVAADGEEALQMLQSKRVDIFVMDLLLPKYDGLTILERLRNDRWNHPQVLVTSAFISHYVAASVVRLGAKQLIHKPCSVNSVIENLQWMSGGMRGGPVIFLWNGEKNLESLVTSILRDIGVPANIRGYHYLREAIIIATRDMDVLNAVTRVLYAQLAKAFQTTPRRVEQAIRHAVEVAWDRGDLDTLQRYFGYTVSNTKGKPTNSEFIAIVADQIQLWLKENADQLK